MTHFRASSVARQVGGRELWFHPTIGAAIVAKLP
jgi:hypothetical protein